MAMHLLEGVAPEDDRDARIVELERTTRQLRRDLATAKAEVQRVQDETAAALGNLRRQLGPLYRALQMVFGELDAVGVTETTTANAPAPARASAVWENWKQRLGPTCAKIIDALLLHGAMSHQQIAIAIGSSRQNVSSNLMPKLNRAGIIEKNNGRFSLKSLT